MWIFGSGPAANNACPIFFFGNVRLPNWFFWKSAGRISLSPIFVLRSQTSTSVNVPEARFRRNWPQKIFDFARQESTKMAETPRYAHLIALLFLGSGFVIFVCLLVAFVAAFRKAGKVGKFAVGGAALVAIGYTVALFGLALATSNKTLPPGDWKYFCEA